MSEPDEGAARDRRRVTSLELSRGKIAGCWLLGLAATVAGGTATFLRNNQAGSAALVLLGSVLIFLALMERVPLALEVGSTKLDATYDIDRAFEAGKERGLEEAVEDVEDSMVRGESPADVLGRLKEALNDQMLTEPEPSGRAGGLLRELHSSESEAGYRGPTACLAAGITYRQLDYWVRTGLVTPSSPDRLFSVDDILRLKVTRRLLDAGVSLHHIRRLVGDLVNRSLDDFRNTIVASDGERVWEVRTDEDFGNIVRSGKGIIGIDIGRLVDEVRSSLARLGVPDGGWS